MSYYRVDWPQQNPLLIATLDTFDSGGYKAVRRIVSDFVKANAPPSHKIYFAVAAEREESHREAGKILQANGDEYQILKSTPRSKSRFSTMLSSRRREDNRRILVGSVHTGTIVEKLLDVYYHEWYLESVVPFIVSKGDPPEWGRQLMNLTGPRNRALLNRDTIEESHCVMTTLWEHGMILVSDKISQPDLIATTRRIAASNKLNLSVNEAEITSDKRSWHESVT